MKGVFFKLFLISVLFLTSVGFVFCETFIVHTDQQEKNSTYKSEIEHSYYGTHFDIITQQEDVHPFAFTASPLGHALRLSLRLIGELYAAESDDLIKNEILQNINVFCDQALDLSTLSDIAFLYVKKQIAVMPEKQNYFCEEVHHFRQKINMLSEYFASFIEGQELSPELITICVVFDRIVKKTGQMLAL